jgi:uncharacterized protein (TIGR00730 family)
VTGLRRVCVFAGASSGSDPVYRAAAEELGRVLVANGVGLVYGGARVGLMGALADAVLSSRGEVIGVLPSPFDTREVAHDGLSDLRIVSSMHERKALMADLADGFIALPGGLGTLDELFEALTWAQLGIHQKPCGLINVHGYFDPLLAFLRRSIDEEFVGREHERLLLVADSPGGVLDLMGAYEPPLDRPWLVRA